MTDIIKLLPDNIANQIAAGEVVQRPASVVKELMENSVDAGSRTIKLFIKNSGKTLVQVMDDGCGMSETDARMCFERHATSKIRELNDLYQIHTLGFRGEAMASIAAVAQVELKTKRKTDEVGSLLQTENSEVISQEACACPDGTSITVKNLFYNVPARRNFLKSNSVELRHIIDEFLRVALANPEIHFVMFNETEEVFHLRSGNLKQRIISIFGKKYEEGLVPVEEKTELLTIRGFIGKPEVARKTRGEQFFFANDRFIRNAYLNHAVNNAFEELLPIDAFPFYVIFMDIPPARIDINVHPTKTEIKFEDEKMIYAIMRSAVRKSLSQYHVAPALNFEEETSIGIPSTPYSSQETSLRTGPVPGSDTSPASGNRESHTSGSGTRQKANPQEWEELYKVLNMSKGASGNNTGIPAGLDADDEEEDDEQSAENLPGLAEDNQKPVLQLHKKFILSPIRSGLMIVQQNLAHERILFERYLTALEGSKVYSQQLLFPEVIHLQPADFAIVKEILSDIRNLGFDLDEFGKNAYVLNGIPVDMQGHPHANILERIIEEYKNAESLDKLSKQEKLARALARNAAIKVGKVLAGEEMTSLIDELFACRTPYFSPDGKPVLITIPADELDKKFKKN
jgi:DNA mismatch repair protein MutL